MSNTDTKKEPSKKELPQKAVVTEKEVLEKEKITDNPVKKLVKKPFIKSKRLVGFKEFASSTQFTSEFLAGFRMYLKVNHKPEFMSDSEWFNVLQEYKTRKI